MFVGFAPLQAHAQTLNILYAFTDGNDGGLPSGSLIRDSDGNLYGVTEYGGGKGTCDYNDFNGCGVVFKLAPNGTETVLHAFAGGTYGANPTGSLTADRKGNLYGVTPWGTTCSGGASSKCSTSYGMVFKIAPDGKYRVIYRFCSQPNCMDGSAPNGGMIQTERVIFMALRYLGVQQVRVSSSDSRRKARKPYSTTFVLNRSVWMALIQLLA